METNCLWWLSNKWAAAGRPVIPLPEWEELMKRVGVMTEKKAIH